MRYATFGYAQIESILATVLRTYLRSARMKGSLVASERKLRMTELSFTVRETVHAEIRGMAIKAATMPRACRRVTRSLRMMLARSTVTAG